MGLLSDHALMQIEAMIKKASAALNVSYDELVSQFNSEGADFIKGLNSFGFPDAKRQEIVYLAAYHWLDKKLLSIPVAPNEKSS